MKKNPCKILEFRIDKNQPELTTQVRNEAINHAKSANCEYLKYQMLISDRNDPMFRVGDTFCEGVWCQWMLKI
ncbi:hypothetical protein E6Q11_00885 [Candidatus Dojkabacteria bacterium]|uniref:Uncharacterized protein n=1 Tax=Candidatus Dojkabacteria bacterium TaxID=2099670 RepID=A0A5C7JAN1_9BACT|nr:MAG: hypothetical protein E6Q11_00885 [Candidatus Dojkabacteria bacterium]